MSVILDIVTSAGCNKVVTGYDIAGSECDDIARRDLEARQLRERLERERIEQRRCPCCGETITGGYHVVL